MIAKKTTNHLSGKDIRGIQNPSDKGFNPITKKIKINENHPSMKAPKKAAKAKATSKKVKVVKKTATPVAKKAEKPAKKVSKPKKVVKPVKKVVKPVVKVDKVKAAPVVAPVEKVKIEIPVVETPKAEKKAKPVKEKAVKVPKAKKAKKVKAKKTPKVKTENIAPLEPEKIVSEIIHTGEAKSDIDDLINLAPDIAIPEAEQKPSEEPYKPHSNKNKQVRLDLAQLAEGCASIVRDFYLPQSHDALTKLIRLSHPEAEVYADTEEGKANVEITISDKGDDVSFLIPRNKYSG